MSRKIFNYDNLEESTIVNNIDNNIYKNIISACGCLFIRVHNKKLQLLLISYKDPNWPKYDDFGGRIDIDDNTVNDAICREVSEETNDVITKKQIKKTLMDDNIIFYNRQSKYYCVVHQIDNFKYNDSSIFGDFEKTDKIYRTINWFDYDKVKSKLAFRLLNNKKLIEYLNNI